MTEQFKSSGVAEMSNLAFTATENAPVNAVSQKASLQSEQVMPQIKIL